MLEVVDDGVAVVEQVLVGAHGQDAVLVLAAARGHALDVAGVAADAVLRERLNEDDARAQLAGAPGGAHACGSAAAHDDVGLVHLLDGGVDLVRRTDLRLCRESLPDRGGERPGRRQRAEASPGDGRVLDKAAT